MNQLFKPSAEYEAFYNGYWRDIDSNFTQDMSKAGNSFVRAVRWDNSGYRSYRNDRGLIIRQKEKDRDKDIEEELIEVAPEVEEESFQPDPFNILNTVERTETDISAIEGESSFIGAFAKSFALSTEISFATSLTSKSFTKFVEPKIAQQFGSLGGSKVGDFLSKNKVGLAFTALNLVQDTGQSTTEKLTQAAISLGTSALITKFAGPYGFLIGPAIGIVKGLAQGENIEQIAGKTAGHIFGARAGRSVFDKISTPTPTTTTTPKTNTVWMQHLNMKTNEENKSINIALENIRAARSLSTSNPRVEVGSYLTKNEGIFKTQNTNRPALESKLSSLKSLASHFNKKGRIF